MRSFVRLSFVTAKPLGGMCSIFFAKEVGVAVMSALDNVQGDAIKVYTGATGHERSIAEIFKPEL